MENYIVQVTSKPGHEEPVTQFYHELGPLLSEAKGFRSRKIYRGQTGRMAEGVKSIYTAEELAKHAEPPHEHPGTAFVIVEQWDSLEDRMRFGKDVQGALTPKLIEHLMPNHGHEFFEDVSDS